MKTCSESALPRSEKAKKSGIGEDAIDPSVPCTAKKCEPSPEDLTAARLGPRLDVQARKKQIDTLNESIRRVTNCIKDLTQQRLQLCDLVVVWANAIKGGKNQGEMRGQSLTKRKKLLKAVNIAKAAFPDLKDRLQDWMGPVTPVASMLDAILQAARSDKAHIRYSPALLSFCLSMTASSDAAYRQLRAACPTVPSRETVAAYRFEVYWGSGILASTRRLTHKRLLLDMWVVDSRTNEFSDSNGLAPASARTLAELDRTIPQDDMRRYGTLEVDEVKVQSGLVYRVRKEVHQCQIASVSATNHACVSIRCRNPTDG